jgi:hypothetical protein
MSGFVDTLPAGNTQAKTPTDHKLNLDEILEPPSISLRATGFMLQRNYDTPVTKV